MNNPNNIIVTDIEPPIIVQSQKGRKFEMTDRPNYGLTLCISGQITYEMNNIKYVSTPNNAILLPQDGNYTLYGDKEGLFPVVNFSCNNFSCDEIMVFPLEQAQGCLKTFEALKNSFEQSNNSLEIYSIFYDLLNKVFSKGAKNPSAIDFAIKYIEENLQNPNLSNNILAEKIGISEVYLRRLFLSHCGITPKQYVLKSRIHKAKQLLIDTPFTVTVIAAECGFSSVYHFCRCFKQHTGQTPIQYASANRIYKI